MEELARLLFDDSHLFVHSSSLTWSALFARVDGDDPRRQRTPKAHHEHSGRLVLSFDNLMQQVPSSEPMLRTLMDNATRALGEARGMPGQLFVNSASVIVRPALERQFAQRLHVDTEQDDLSVLIAGSRQQATSFAHDDGDRFGSFTWFTPTLEAGDAIVFSSNSAPHAGTCPRSVPPSMLCRLRYS